MMSLPPRPDLSDEDFLVLLRQLTPREEMVLRMRWGIDQAAATFAEIAKACGVSTSRIRQIQAKALRKIEFKMSGH